MSINQAEIAKHIRGILVALGEDPDREGLQDTPQRVASMYAEIFAGIAYTNDQLVDMFNKTFEEDINTTEDSQDIVVMKDIEIFSHCEHHLALMYNMKVTIAYIPKDKVIGLSKMARIADMVGKRLQLQERIGQDIAEIMQKITETEDVAVIIEGEHGCMTTRGIKKPNAKTVTMTLRGNFNTDINLLNRLLILCK
ncbi:GTP cyclohydrolase I [Desulfonispora thiosulfatigenes DSM 11270]|uniref:GTP cyclohydrolase 1 n=1 Tax=Desulfonispora thiosulfatigenes DSM 11270 TaxID=656914 RepID=A0A1W1ULI9_DESTI|nr:GTP cyclohydrolase I FolE [Desulfonispora thiosulfatigenes]SMB81883.1 GTP cyclohydrolase I [Desulfonispora thiosulfatigenes DSM 11270]